MGRGDNGVIADLGHLLGVETDLGAQVIGQHLRAKADAEKRLYLLQCDADPFRLAADEFVLVVGAHGTAEYDGAAVVGERLGQRVTVPGLADVERITVAAKPLADVARIGPLVVEHDAHRLLCGWRR